MGDGVELEVTGAPGRRGSPTAQDLEPGEELAHLEGLGDVVLGPGREPRQALVQGVQGGEEQHGGLLTARLQGLDDVTTVGVGQADVHDQHVEVAVGEDRDASAPLKAKTDVCPPGRAPA